jgi:glutamate racemase
MLMPATPAPTIGIFDSGVGGLTVLRALRHTCPDSAMVYVADTAHAPYGDREIQHTLNRSQIIADHLVAQGATMVVVACNTATALAIEHLRARYPTLALVGVEPGVKPAVALSKNRKIGVLATPATVASGRYAQLLAKFAPDCVVVSMACPGLAAAIEADAPDQRDIGLLLTEFCEPLRRAEVDTVVLGCTHYAFVAEAIQQRLGPRVRLIDTADAVARQARSLLDKAPAHPAEHADTTRIAASAPVRLFSTGDTQVLNRLATHLLGQHTPASLLSL